MKKTTKLLALLLSALLLLPVFAGCDEDTSGKNEKNTEAEQSSHQHDYADASCTLPRTCKICGLTTGQALGHTYTGTPTCTEPQSCERCGQLGETVLGHDYADATCTAPKQCKRCNLIISAALGHDYAPAGCTSPQICKRCEQPHGEALGHDFAYVDCDTPKACTRCSATEGEAPGHSYNSDHKCIRCQAVDPNSLPVALDQLHVISSERATIEREAITDTYGDAYVSSAKYTSSSTSFSTHNLRKEFTTFSGSIVSTSETSLAMSVLIEFYVDGVLKHSISAYGRETGKIDFSIDVSQGSTLKINLTGNAQGNAQIHIVNAQLTR